MTDHVREPVPRIAALRLDEAELQWAQQASTRGGRCELTLPAGTRTNATAALLYVGDEVKFAARVLSEGAGGDLRRKFLLTHLTALPDLTLTGFAQHLSVHKARPLFDWLRPVLGPQASTRVRELLTGWYPEVAVIFESVAEGPDPGLVQTRINDAKIFTGVELKPASSVGAPLVAWEEDFTIYDAGHMPGMRAVPSGDIRVQEFVDARSSSRLRIVKIDRKPVEGATGADLLYYHVGRDSFVLVQYKRMWRDGRVAYVADRDFEAQLAKLRSLDAASPDRSSEGADAEVNTVEQFRLNGETGYVKFVDPTRLGTDDDITSGLCMTAEQVTRYLGKGQRKFSTDSIPDYMTATTFAELVARGLIGSTRDASSRVRDVLKRLLLGQDVVLALFTTSNRV